MLRCLAGAELRQDQKPAECASVGQNEMERRQRALNLGIRCQGQPPHPQQASSPLHLPLSATTEPPCPSQTCMLPLFLGQELEWLHPLWATQNLAQAPLPLPEPGILNTLDTLQREDFFSGFYTCLQTLGVCLQCRDEVTRLSSWTTQGLWRSPSHRCTDLPSIER